MKYELYRLQQADVNFLGILLEWGHAERAAVKDAGCPLIWSTQLVSDELVSFAGVEDINYRIYETAEV